MKREKEIDVAATHYDYDYNSGSRISAYCCFRDGAEWADMNPKFHWISTNQDLPHNYEDLISEPDFRTVKVLVIDRDTKEISLDYMENTVRNKWRFVNTNPIYWMPIPNLA